MKQGEMKEDEAKRRMEHLGMWVSLGTFRNGRLRSKETICSLEVTFCLLDRGKRKKTTTFVQILLL